MTDPLSLFKSDRNRARDAQDPMANLCTVGHNSTHTADMRTLVLRDVGEDLAIFINQTSPKWERLETHASVLTYWPSIQVQFRMQTTVTDVDSDFVAESWQLRPDPPKKMDWFYTKIQSQSSSIGSRKNLLDQVEQLQLPEPLIAPDTSRGLILQPYRIERLDLTQENGIHDRTLFELTDGQWRSVTLVP